MINENNELDLLTPEQDYEMTDEEWADVLRTAGRVARWQEAMAERGIKVLAMNLSPKEEEERALKWEREEALTHG